MVDRSLPDAPLPQGDGVPESLKLRAQWLIWRFEPPEKAGGKPRKMPYYANGHRRSGVQGSPEDRGALVMFADAMNACIVRAASGECWGAGFAFLPDDGLAGIDLDGMIDVETGEINERGQGIIAACASFTEFSPSGKGVHIICTSAAFKSFKNNAVGVEVFCGAQYFTVTGRRWPGSPPEIQPLSEVTLRRLQATVKAAKARPSLSSPGDSPVHSLPFSPGASQAISVPAPGGRHRSMAETVAVAEEALSHLDPSEYHGWIQMGLACKADLGSAGYLVWDTWSSRSPNYAGQEDTFKRWKGMEPSTLTLAALFSRAEAAGWVSPWAKARARKSRAKPVAPAAPPRVHNPAPAGAFEGGKTFLQEEEAGNFPSDTAPYPLQAGAGGGDGLPPDGAPAMPPEPPPDDNWKDQLIYKKGEVSPCLANADLVLSHMPVFDGVIAYDEFSERTVFRRALPFDRSGPAEGEWTDHLDTRTAIYLQRTWSVEFSPTNVGKAVENQARLKRFHPVRDALRALPPWDGVRRGGDWLSDYLGVKKTEYTALVGQFFLRAIVKRVMQPGCKFDYCLVLEGPQGKGKSTAARILGWHWFGDTDLDLNNKDALLALPGHLVYEISEMGSLMKAEAVRQKSFLSRQEDEYRPPYGVRQIKVPRQCVFIGSTNEEQYLKDHTGGRRFWPVACEEEFNLEALQEALPQLYAEALSDYYGHERCWPTQAEQDTLFTPEQAKRGMEEPFEDILWRWVDKQVMPFSMADAAMGGLSLTADKLTPAIVTRVGCALRKIGCARKENRLAEDPGRRRLYFGPKMKDVASADYGRTREAMCVESDDVGF